MTVPEDVRFERPLYTIAEAARYVRVSASTYGTWARGYERRFPDGRVVKGGPVIGAFPAPRGKPSVPFIGLAESMVIKAFRRSGVSLQHIRAVLPMLKREVGVEHALASRNLYTDGASILFDYARHDAADAEEASELEGLTRVVDGQRVFGELVAEYLERIAYGDDGWAAELILPFPDRHLLKIRPGRAGGRPVFLHGDARLEDVVRRWRAGDRLTAIAKDFEVPLEDAEDAVRVAVGQTA